LIELNQRQNKEILALKDELLLRNQNKIKFEKMYYEDKLMVLNTDNQIKINNMTNEIEYIKSKIKTKEERHITKIAHEEEIKKQKTAFHLKRTSLLDKIFKLQLCNESNKHFIKDSKNDNKKTDDKNENDVDNDNYIMLKERNNNNYRENNDTQISNLDLQFSRFSSISMNSNTLENDKNDKNDPNNKHHIPIKDKTVHKDKKQRTNSNKSKLFK